MTIWTNFTIVTCVSNRLTIFIQKTNSNSSQITFMLIEKYFNWLVKKIRLERIRKRCKTKSIVERCETELKKLELINQLYFML